MINRLMFIITMGKVTFQTRIVASVKCKCTSINVRPNGTYIHPRLYLVFSCLHEIILIVFFKSLNRYRLFSQKKLLKGVISANLFITFCGFMVFSAVSLLCRSDFTFSSTWVKVIIQKSKREICREGNVGLHLSFYQNLCIETTCQVFVLKIFKNPDKSTFRGTSSSKKLSLPTKSKLISYRKIQYSFAQVLRPVNLDWKNNRLHSLRSNGASLVPYNDV